MSDVCNTCGLPKELCVCETIAKESQRIVIKLVKKKFGKPYTAIDGINAGEINIKDLTKKLKSKLSCGGTCKSGVIELQGNHLRTLKDEMVRLGFSPETIEVVPER